MKRRSFIRAVAALPFVAAATTVQRGVAAETAPSAHVFLPMLAQADVSRIAFVNSSPTPTSEIYVRYAAHDTPIARIPNDISQVGVPDWSPDGTQLAFSLAPAVAPNPADIVVTASDGSEMRRLTTMQGEERADWPKWSRDGSRIAFSATVNGVYQVYIIQQDGTQARRVWQSDREDRVLGWSLDNKYIVFRSVTQTSDVIYRIDPDIGEAQIVTAPALGGYGTAWSPDGAQVAFSEVVGTQYGGPIARIFLINSDGSGRKQISDTSEIESHSAPVWSPDGRKIAYSASSLHWSWIYLINADGSGDRQLLAGNRAYGAAWTR